MSRICANDIRQWKYWNTIYLDRDMPDSEIKHWIHHSYREVIAKLPKKIREAYENE